MLKGTLLLVLSKGSWALCYETAEETTIRGKKAGKPEKGNF